MSGLGMSIFEKGMQQGMQQGKTEERKNLKEKMILAGISEEQIEAVFAQ